VYYKNKYCGAVSPLCRWARHRHQSELSIKCIGVEGAFTCFDENNRLKEEKLLFIAGGVGITPFMAMLGVLTKRSVNVDVMLLFSARGEEIGLAARFRDAGVDTRIFDRIPRGRRRMLRVFLG
jgi:ferredoxin-NADP reductase